MAAPNSAPRSDWPAPLFKIRTLEGGQELPVRETQANGAIAEGVAGQTKKYEKNKIKGEFHVYLHSHVLGRKFSLKCILTHLACDSDNTLGEM